MTVLLLAGPAGAAEAAAGAPEAPPELPPLPPPPLYPQEVAPPPPARSLAFVPRFAPVGALTISIGGGRIGWGGELGLRRWLNRHMIFSGLLQYERALWSDWPRLGAGARSHILGLVTRLEFTWWDAELRSHLNMPDASIYPLAGVVTAIDPTGTTGTGIGFRAGGGATAFHYTGSFALPLTIQGYYQQIHFPGARAHGATLTIGLGM